ncbi:MAG: SusD/RagB family nutrient-binding outer membrane lipoprotein [Flexibacter sp. CG_4_10_14_3_um_filter_32_15]|nr:MAG: SusD/RagB family nutrient-binding outer membrane lipoprotein [Flexibacter sp. CG_4_10_14_3_um_filter_32_15]
MKKRIIALILAASCVTFTSCDQRLEELNTDKINPAQVSASSLFTKGLKEGFDMMGSINVNNNPFRLYAQYWAQTTYPEESQYSLTSRNIPDNFWAAAYRNVLLDLAEAKKITKVELENDAARTATLTNRIACIEIMSAYTYTTLVDVFGNVPYTEALDVSNLSPKYDDARTIYSDLITRLDAAINSTDMGTQGFTASQDPLFNGDMSQWIKFANSLKFRMGMRLADVDKSASVSIVNSALAGGILESNGDNVRLEYMSSSPNTNPVYEDLVLSGRNDFVLANTFADYLNTTKDPRVTAYAQANPVPFANGADYVAPTDMYVLYDDATSYVTAGTVIPASSASRNPRIFIGGTYGDANSFNSNSKVSRTLYTDPTYGVTLINYAEMRFLMAEAAARGGYAITGSAAEHYAAGITASFEEFNVEGVDEYLAQSHVAYATAEGDFRTKIGRQMWVALYNEGSEAWATWRRLDFGVLRPLPEETTVTLPLRFTYPIAEQQLNGTQYSAAGSAIGGDAVTTKLFWDVQ